MVAAMCAHIKGLWVSRQLVEPICKAVEDTDPSPLISVRENVYGIHYGVVWSHP